MAIMTINAVAKAGSASWTGNYSLIWSSLKRHVTVSIIIWAHLIRQKLSPIHQSELACYEFTCLPQTMLIASLVSLPLTYTEAWCWLRGWLPEHWLDGPSLPQEAADWSMSARDHRDMTVTNYVHYVTIIASWVCVGMWWLPWLHVSPSSD